MIDKTRLVMRNGTKYLEQRVERTRAAGFIDDVLTSYIELKGKKISKVQIRLYDIVTGEQLKCAERLFHYGKSFQDLNWRRNSKIEFEGTVYRLRKCKGKNDQEPGKKELHEIRNPRNIKIRELETDNEYSPKKKNKRRKKAETKCGRRRCIKLLEREQKEDQRS